MTEAQVQTLHGLAMTGKAVPSPYRDGQNVIRDSASGRIVYMPPEAPDVATLMGDPFTWLAEQRGSRELPVPITAGLAHYQFAAIHPYFDGNGRTARLLTTLLLHRAGYGLKGIYMRRVAADLSGWVEYFCLGVADAFARIGNTDLPKRHSKPEERIFTGELWFKH